MSDLLDFSPPGQTTFSLAGAKARFYNAGTTTLRTVYADQGETIPHPDPLEADASGRFPQAFVSGGPVKVVVTQANDATGYTLDPCEKVAASGAGASGISFEPTLDLPFDNVQDAIEGAAASAASGFIPFGLGVSGSVTLLADLNAAGTATGQYRFDGTTTGTFPTGVAAADTGAVAIIRETSGSAWMWLYHDTTDRVFIRRLNASTWGAWRENITVDIGAARGDIIYRSATNWTRLPAGTAGRVLQTNGAAADPSWVAPPNPVKAWVNFNGVPQNGTYSRTGTLVTVTMTAHGMTTGMVANLDFTTGTATDGSYTVTVVDANTFTVVDTASGTTSGNVTRTLFIRSSSNVGSVVRNGVGNYSINFSPALSDNNFLATVSCQTRAGGQALIPSIHNSDNTSGAVEVAPTTTSMRVAVSDRTNFTSDSAYVSVLVVR